MINSHQYAELEGLRGDVEEQITETVLRYMRSAN